MKSFSSNRTGLSYSDYKLIKRRLYERKASKIYLEIRLLEVDKNTSIFSLMADDKYLETPFHLLDSIELEEQQVPSGVKLVPKGGLRKSEIQDIENPLYYFVYVDNTGEPLHIDSVIRKDKEIEWNGINISNPKRRAR